MNLNLVSKSNSGELSTTSHVIAEGTESQHRAVLQLIRQNLPDFEDFGRVAFKMQPFETAGGIQSRNVAILNREHAMLLMTYMRNNEIVRSFKKNLIQSFVEMEKQLSVPTLTGPELLAHAVLEAQSMIETQAQQIKELEPAAKSWENLAAPGGDYSVAQAAKVLSRAPGIEMGRNRLFDYLAEIKWIFKTKGKRAHWEAYQPKIDAGLLTHKLGGRFINEQTEEWEQANPTVRITAKGIHQLHKQLNTQNGTLFLIA